MTDALHQAQQLLDFIDASPSPSHAVSVIVEKLLAFHFIPLDEKSKWDLQAGGRYFVVRDDSSIVIFVLGHQAIADSGFKIIGAHTDSPGLRIKPNISAGADGFFRLGVEVYGSPILATFADRDLSLAGRISYQDADGGVSRCLVNFDRPLLRLPNLAIHLNRGVNDDGLKLQKQMELPLLLARAVEGQLPQDYFLALLEQQTGIGKAAILSWELNAYDTQKGSLWGANSEFFSDSQLDNLASCDAALQALLDESVLQSDATLVCAFFDHEEIGSESKKGADGNFLPDVLMRIGYALEAEHEDVSRALANSFLISADMAHAYQPNFPNAYDADHKALVNNGPVIKVNASQRYSTESLSEAQFAQWCELENVPYQKYSHRCDLPCGTTIGPITSAKLGIRSVDVGNPLWAMHSIRESAGVLDHHYMIKVMRRFFTS
ncbi:M18 family aminopeptidase [Methylosoma difficile]